MLRSLQDSHRAVFSDRCGLFRITKQLVSPGGAQYGNAFVQRRVTPTPQFSGIHHGIV